MSMLWRLSREAIRYKGLYFVAILSTLGLTAVNLTAPKEGTLDADGNPHRPGFADLSKIIEETYTRAEP